MKQILSAALVFLSFTAFSQKQLNTNETKASATQKAKIQSLYELKLKAAALRELKAPCKYDELREALFKKDPAARTAFELENQKIQKIVERMEREQAAGNYKAGVITIPVVFHIMHTGTAIGTGANIRDEQILSAVEALNRDFRRKNTDGGIAQGAGPDTEIEFCLAAIDPNGNPTTGINRINASSVSNYTTQGIDESVNGAALKNLSKWPTKDYVNIWIVREIDNQGEMPNWNGGTLGYAYPVSGSATNNPNSNPTNNSLDGIVQLYFATGNDPAGTNSNFRLVFDLNRTLTHEMGHHLNLQHTFDANTCNESNCQTEGDFVCDTPPTIQQTSCNAPACGGTQQVRNYMDYTGETCANMFSAGQKTRMRAVLEGTSRSSLAASNKCAVTLGFDMALKAITRPTANLCGNVVKPEIIIENRGTTTITTLTVNYNVDGGTNQTFSWTGSLATFAKDTFDLNNLNIPTGNHTLNITIVDPNGQTDQNANNNSLSQAVNVTAGNGVTFTLTPDCYGDEITWEIRNAANTVVSSGGPYTNSANPTTITQAACLASACYTLRVMDSFSDGLSGSTQASCGKDGNFELTDNLGQSLAKMGNANYGALFSQQFCVPLDPNSITAKFTASPLVAEQGQNVDFTDLSTSATAASTWLWNFGDGTTATTKNPTHSYSTLGFKTVKLTVGNGFDTDTLTKTAYINVVAPTNTCDNMSNVGASEQITFYGLGAGNGFFPGHSSFQWSKFADRHFVTRVVKVKEIIVPVAKAFAANANNNVVFAIYADNNGLPGTLLGSKTVKINTLVPVDFNTVVFDNPISVNGTFHVGFEIDKTKNDTVVVYTAVNRGTGGKKTASVLNNGTWVDADAILSGDFSTSLGIELVFDNPAPIANFTLSDSVICKGESINFNSSAQNANSLSWTFGNGTPNTSATSNPSVTFNTAGTFLVELTATNSCGDSNKKSVTVAVKAKPVLSMSSTPAGCGQDNGTASVSITAGSTYSINWNDALQQSTTTASNLAPGTYTVTVNDEVCGTVKDSVAVGAANNVTAIILASDSSVCIGDSVTLSGLGASDYAWLVNNAVASQLKDFSFIASTSQVIKLVVSSGSCSDTTQFELSVQSNLPTSTISLNEDTICKGDLVIANTSGSDSYEWYLDGVLKSNANFYEFTPSNTAILKLVSYLGVCKAESNKTVSVADRPIAIASANTQTVDLKISGTINFSSAGSTGTSFNWKFGDGNTSSLANPSHTYTAVGEYLVELNTTLGDCFSADTINVKVNNTTSINEVLSNKLKVYPNPSADELFISNVEKLQIINITVLDMLGKVILTNNSSSDISVKNLSNGVYNLIITTNEGEVNKRFEVLK